jgi:hypothetical protein
MRQPCAKCQRPIEKHSGGISIFVMGDEYLYTYWFCPACQLYTLRSFHDRFMGESEEATLGAHPKAVGDRALALIAACPDPSDKWCECASHKALYYGLPRD